jgi:hypothetical protein
LLCLRVIYGGLSVCEAVSAPCACFLCRRPRGLRTASASLQSRPRSCALRPRGRAAAVPCAAFFPAALAPAFVFALPPSFVSAFVACVWGRGGTVRAGLAFLVLGRLSASPVRPISHRGLLLVAHYSWTRAAFLQRKDFSRTQRAKGYLVMSTFRLLAPPPLTVCIPATHTARSWRRGSAFLPAAHTRFSWFHQHGRVPAKKKWSPSTQGFSCFDAALQRPVWRLPRRCVGICVITGQALTAEGQLDGVWDAHTQRWFSATDFFHRQALRHKDTFTT